MAIFKINAEPTKRQDPPFYYYYIRRPSNFFCCYLTHCHVQDITHTKTYFNVQSLYCLYRIWLDWHVFGLFCFFFVCYPHTYLGGKEGTKQHKLSQLHTYMQQHLLLLLICNFCPVKYWILVGTYKQIEEITR
jgi:hypothetical protein